MLLIANQKGKSHCTSYLIIDQVYDMQIGFHLVAVEVFVCTESKYHSNLNKSWSW